MSEDQIGVAIVNGKIQPLAQANIPLCDRGFLFGHSLFETLLVHKGKIVGWEDHFARLKQGCTRTFIALPDEEYLKELAQTAVEENIKQSGRVNLKANLRIIVTGGSSLDLPIKRENGHLPKSNVVILCRNVSGPQVELYEKGTTLFSFQDFRNSSLIELKSTNYLFNLIAIETARTHGFDDALFYRDEFFTESTTANFIWFDENKTIYSAPPHENCLAGTTLSLLKKMLDEMQMPFQWKALGKHQLPQVCGCALVSSVRGVLPVRQIDHMRFDVEGHNMFFKQLKQLLEKNL